MNKLKCFVHSLFQKVEQTSDLNLDDKVNSDSNLYEVEFLDRKSIRILTYNMFLRPLVHTNSDDHKYERLVDFFDELKDFDIICFQEVFSFVNFRKELLILEAAKRGFYYYYGSPEPGFLSPFSFDAGLLIISRFKIEETDFYPFTYANDIDAIVNKGLLYVKIKVKNNYIHLMTTHLQATYYQKKEEKLYVSYITRKTQIEELSYYIDICLKKQVKSSHDKILFMGDLNVPAGSKDNLPFLYKKDNNEYDFLINEINSYNYYKCTNIYYKEKNEHPHTFGGFDPVLYDTSDYDTVMGLDYIFEIHCDFKDNEKCKFKVKIDYSTVKIQEFKVRKENDRKRKYHYLSDHRGLSVDIVIEQ